MRFANECTYASATHAWSGAESVTPANSFGYTGASMTRIGRCDYQFLFEMAQ